ncbi:cytochrome b/b6 domain-containing protein [Synechococcus sp. ATX 2A4]|uniref:cytochrome b/b6 domain-containing protein n=1 Tax=Synechococcus sp. ATX 2A4 TaxID=2823727 RepID=UPI0020CEBAE2|nr:cytochrome b/b6 domain-containing protein [Synechococcus sp. ATX 2A4]MCP9884107.1 cytochrome b/b6 domain-containing protein [Synechococcus sp. ATX 2A4]
MTASRRHHPLWTRAFHAFNVVVLLVMAASGLQIYNANPVFGGQGGPTVPELFTLGGWLAGGRDWHFGFMGLYASNLGLWIALLIQRRRDRLAHSGDLATLNASSNLAKRRVASHRVVYTLMLILLAFGLITGLAMYKPAQFWWLSGLFSFGELFGATSWHTLRVFHLATIPAIALLTVVHLALSWRIGGWLLWRSILA